MFELNEVRPPAGNGARPEVSVLEVAPALLQTLGVEPPAYMARPKTLAELLPDKDAATGPGRMSGMSSLSLHDALPI